VELPVPADDDRQPNGHLLPPLVDAQAVRDHPLRRLVLCHRQEGPHSRHTPPNPSAAWARHLCRPPTDSHSVCVPRFSFWPHRCTPWRWPTLSTCCLVLPLSISWIFLCLGTRALVHCPKLTYTNLAPASLPPLLYRALACVRACDLRVLRALRRTSVIFVLAMEYLVLSKTASPQVISSTLLLLLGTHCTPLDCPRACLRSRYRLPPSLSCAMRPVDLIARRVYLLQGRWLAAGPTCTLTRSAMRSPSV
jgi:hypothetical protein